MPCGGGTQTRACNNPAPYCGGAACSGATSQSCNEQQCIWTKLKDSSFLSKNSLVSHIPIAPVPYDSDDDGTANFISGEGGLVAASSVDLDSVNASAKASTHNWSTDYSATTPPSGAQSPTAFLSYVKSKKTYVKITTLDDSAISANGIYLWNSSADVDINSVPAKFNAYNIVLLSEKPINIGTELNKTADSDLKSIALVAPEINFAASVTQADGIFIGDIILRRNVAQGM